MNILGKISEYGQIKPSVIAHQYCDEHLTYGELTSQSDALASFIVKKYDSDKTPIIVYGGKQNLMLVCFLASVKSGHAYIPIDSSLPVGRVEDIIISSNPKLIFAIDEIPSFPVCEAVQVINRIQIDTTISEFEGSSPSKEFAVKQHDNFYIIYTSGSTGKPKGVQITRSNLESFLKWCVELIPPPALKNANTFLNQAPFSFDLSVMDTYLSLSLGGTLVSVDKKMSMQDLFSSFKNSNISIWVSTPSFADLCLADSAFNSEMLTNIKKFLFCGETLTNETVTNLHHRFPDAEVINMYGPTEATVAVTQLTVTSEINRKINPLPVGAVKKDCNIWIMDNDELLAESKVGEIVITGKSVSPGYYNSQEMTDRVFKVLDSNNRKIYAYRTGDKGYLKDGMLYFCGRLDFQVKLNGFRIEIEDIENNIRKLPRVQNVVVIPTSKQGKVTKLNAYIRLRDISEDTSLKATIALKQELGHYIPEYMIPKKIIFVEKFPQTPNGKIDRQALALEENIS